MDISWDAEANVWIAYSKELPGFGLESDSFDLLLAKVLTALPEFIELSQTLTKSFKNKPSQIIFHTTRQISLSYNMAS
ncbi:MAG: DUF1902 domain-containing protein [Deltaproteobacteria bacterium]|nr:DUF1902 domain-containing protein [Deltaproteobacteria bacterium]